MAGLGDRQETQEKVEATPFNVLAQNSPRFNALVHGGMTPEAARSQLANEVADRVPLLAAGAVTGANVLTGAAGAMAKTVVNPQMTAAQFAGRVVQSALEEGGQGAGEGYVMHKANQQVDPNDKFDLGAQVAQGLMSGLGTGIGMHGTGFVGSLAADMAATRGTAVPAATPPATAPTPNQGLSPDVSVSFPGQPGPAGTAGSAQATPPKVEPTLQPTSAADLHALGIQAEPEDDGAATPATPVQAQPTEPAQPVDASPGGMIAPAEDAQTPAPTPAPAETPAPVSATGPEMDTPAAPSGLEASPTPAVPTDPVAQRLAQIVQELPTRSEPVQASLMREAHALMAQQQEQQKASQPQQAQAATVEPQAQPLQQPPQVQQPLQPQQAAPNIDLQNRDRSRAASVMQMTQIAQNPDYQRLGPSRTPETGAPMVFIQGDDSSVIPHDAFGKTDTAVMVDGQRVPFRYAVVNAAQVNPSHFANGSVNPEYASDEPGTIKALNNGRTAGLRAAYQGDTAQGYTSALESDTEAHGVDPAAIQNTPNPMLVRVYSSQDNTPNMADKSQGQAMEQAPAERAQSDANRITSLDGLHPDEQGDIDNPATRSGFIRQFMSSLPIEQQANMVQPDGSLSSAGLTRVRNAVMAKAYGNSPVVQRMTEATDDNTRNITKALIRMAPTVAKARDGIAAGVLHAADISPPLLDAANELSSLKAKGMTVENRLAQSDVFGDTLSDDAREMLQFLDANVRRPNRIAEFLSHYYQALHDAGHPGQQSMFGDTQAPSVRDLMRASMRATGAAHEQTADLFGQQPAAQQPVERPAQGNPRAGAPDRQQPSDAGGGGGGIESDAVAAGGQAATGLTFHLVKQFVADTWAKRRELARTFAERKFAGRSVKNESDGEPIIIPKSGIDHALAGKDIGDAALSAFGRLDEFLQAAKFSHAEPDNKGRNTIKEVRFYDLPIDLDGARSVLRAVVRVAADGRRYYDHFELKEKAPSGQPGKQVNPDSLRPFDGAAPNESDAGNSVLQKSLKTQSEARERQASYRDAADAQRAKELATLSPSDAAAKQEEHAILVRRLQSTGTVKQKSGKPFSSQDSAEKFQAEHDLSITHEVAPEGSGFVLKQRPPAAMIEAQRLTDERESYTEAQDAVLKDMGIAEKPNGEIDATPEQWDEIDRRVNERMDRALAKSKAKADFADALADLAQIASRHTRLSMIPEDTPGLMPTLVKLFDAAIRIVGSDMKAAMSHVKAAMRAHEGTKKLVNLIKPETFAKAAQQAMEQVGSTGKGAAMFSRKLPESKDGTRDTPIIKGSQRTQLFSALAKLDDAFKYVTPKTRTLTGIVREIDPGYRVQDKSASFASSQTNGKANKAWEIFVPGSDVRSGYVYESQTGNVWIDVSRLQSNKDAGSKVYAMVAAYAHNNGKVFVGDPAGLSPIAFGRRLENMISSALKYGTTDHLYPHAAQIDPRTYYRDVVESPEFAKQVGDLALHWKDGDTAHNLAELLRVSYALHSRFAPEIKDTIYDFAKQQFVNADTGEVRPASYFRDLSGRVSGGGQARYRAGSATLARAALVNTLVRGQSPAQQRDIVAALRDQLQGRGLDPALRDIFYSRDQGGDVQGPKAVARAQALAERISALWQNAPPIVVVDSLQDSKVPERVRQHDAEKRSLGAKGEPEGFYYGGKVYLVASQLHSSADVLRVLAHETLGHAGLRGLYGSALDGILDQIVMVRRAEVAAKAESYKFGTSHAELRRAAEEVLATMAQEQPHLGFVRRAIAAIRTWMREHGVGVQMTDDEIIRNWILPARAFIERGAKPAQGLGGLQAAMSRGDDARSTAPPKTVIADFKNDEPLKANSNYKAAKAGNVDAAARLVQALVKPQSIEQARAEFGPDAVYVPVHAEEASGRNQIPNMLAMLYAEKAGGQVGAGIFQTNRAFHTGAKPMERLMTRAEFAGDVTPGAKYVLVDDVTTMGSTLADLAHFIQSRGGNVAGSVVLTNAMREGTMQAPAKITQELEARHGQAISSTIGIKPDALTASEARYLIGFKSTDEFRNRVAAAESERSARLRAKGLLPEREDSPGDLTPKLSRSTSLSTVSRGTIGAMQDTDNAPGKSGVAQDANSSKRLTEKFKMFVQQVEKLAEQHGRVYVRCDLPPSAVPVIKRKPRVARLVDLGGG